MVRLGRAMSWEATNWAVRQKAGSPAAKVVLLLLADRADDQHSCWPSQNRLADDSEQSVPTVRRHLRKLESIGLIRTERRTVPGQKRATNRYVLAVSETSTAQCDPQISTDQIDALPINNADIYRSPVIAEPSLEPPDLEPAPTDRPEIDALCDYLADAIAANGSKRPTVTKGWMEACRLMLDLDERTPQNVRNAIDWCQKDEFWRANIMSMSKLRKQYDTLRLQAMRGSSPSQSSNRDILERFNQELVDKGMV